MAANNMFKEILAVLMLRVRMFMLEPWLTSQERIILYSSLVGTLTIIGYITWKALLPFAHGWLLFLLRLLVPSDTLKAAYLEASETAEVPSAST